MESKAYNLVAENPTDSKSVFAKSNCAETWKENSAKNREKKDWNKKCFFN